MNISVSEGRASILPAVIFASGVAVETASVLHERGAVQLPIAFANEIRRIILAAIAGLAKF